MCWRANRPKPLRGCFSTWKARWTEVHAQLLPYLVDGLALEPRNEREVEHVRRQRIDQLVARDLGRHHVPLRQRWSDPVLEEVVPEVAERALKAERVDSHRALPPQVQLEAWRSCAAATTIRWLRRSRWIVVVLQSLRAGVSRAEHGHAHGTLGRERSSEQGALVRAEQPAQHGHRRAWTWIAGVCG